MRAVVRALRTDDNGVASTVGTIMSLLVFLTFLSLIVNQYVPAWMKDSEAAHTNTVIGQFGALKGAIDFQILAAQSVQNAGQTYIPVTAATAVGLGVDGVPIFTTSTPGTMTASPNAGAFSVTFDYEIQGVRTRVLKESSGSIELDVQNRYYVAQRVVYENGAVIRYQGDGQVIRGWPVFSVRNLSGSLDISFGLVSLYGGGSVTGTTTEVVNSRLFALDNQNYVDFPTGPVLWLNHTSRYGLAWYRFMNETLADALELGGTFFQTPFDVSFTARSGGLDVYSISAVYDPTSQSYTMRLVIYNQPAVLGLGVFRLQHSQVEVRVGESNQNL